MILLNVGGEVVILGLNIGEAVDAADNHCGVFSKAVQDDAQRVLADLVGVPGDADRALGGGEGLVAGKESEALGFFIQKHGAQIAVAQAHLALVGDGTGMQKACRPSPMAGGRFGGGLYAFFQRDGSAQFISPFGVFKGDGLNAFDDFVGVNAAFVIVGLELFKALEAVFFKHGLELIDSSS